MDEKIKLLVFEEDDDKVKNKYVHILTQNDFGIEVIFFDIKLQKEYGAKTFFPWHRIRKIKEVNNDTD